MTLKCLFLSLAASLVLTSSYSQKSANILIPYRVGHQWGYSDTAGRLVLPLAYDSARLFHDYNFLHKNLAFVFTKGKQGLIDTAGQYVIAPRYDQLNLLFPDGVLVDALPVSNKGKHGLINFKGTVIIPLVYDTLQAYDTVYERPEDIRYLGRKGNTYYEFNASGKSTVISRDRFEDLAGRGSGLVAFPPDETLELPVHVSVADTLSKYGIDSMSKRKLKGSAFYLVYKKGKVGLWNQQDTWIAPQFDEVIDYEGHWYSSEHRVFVRKDGRIGVINTQQKIRMPFKYTDYFRWDGYRVYTKDGNKMGLFSISEQADIAPKYDHVAPLGPPEYPLWLVTVNNKKGWVNSRGFEYFRD